MSSSEKISATKNPLGFPKGWSSGFLFNRCPGRRVTLLALVKTLVALIPGKTPSGDTYCWNCGFPGFLPLFTVKIWTKTSWTVWNAKEKKRRKNVQRLISKANFHRKTVKKSSSWLILIPPTPSWSPQLANCYLPSRWHAQDHRNCKRPLPCHHRPQEST